MAILGMFTTTHTEISDRVCPCHIGWPILLALELEGENFQFSRQSESLPGNAVRSRLILFS